MSVFKNAQTATEIASVIITAGLAVALTVAVIIPLVRTSWQEGMRTRERQDVIMTEISDMADL